MEPQARLTRASPCFQLRYSGQGWGVKHILSPAVSESLAVCDSVGSDRIDVLEGPQLQESRFRGGGWYLEFPLIGMGSVCAYECACTCLNVRACK